jgi:hypothetical protein
MLIYNKLIKNYFFGRKYRDLHQSYQIKIGPSVSLSGGIIHSSIGDFSISFALFVT